MHPRFRADTEATPNLFARLLASPPLTFVRIVGMKGKPGIYVFYEDGKAVHVGRTRNFGGRLRAHITANHNSASFAFKRTRRLLNRPATYTKNGSRAALMADERFLPAFLAQIDKIRSMEVRFLELADPVQQYLLELYATLEYDLPLDEFDTH